MNGVLCIDMKSTSHLKYMYYAMLLSYIYYDNMLALNNIVSIQEEAAHLNHLD